MINLATLNKKALRKIVLKVQEQRDSMSRHNHALTMENQDLYSNINNIEEGWEKESNELTREISKHVRREKDLKNKLSAMTKEADKWYKRTQDTTLKLNKVCSTRDMYKKDLERARETRDIVGNHHIEENNKLRDSLEFSRNISKCKSEVMGSFNRTNLKLNQQVIELKDELKQAQHKISTIYYGG